jgi:hypothetical protein
MGKSVGHDRKSHGKMACSYGKQSENYRKIIGTYFSMGFS